MMKSTFKALCGSMALAAVLAAGTAMAQQPLTPRSVDAPLWADGGVGGTTLESLGAKPARTAYIAMGTPRRTAKGEIANAIVINSYYSGDSTAMYNNWVPGQAGNGFSGGPLVGPGLLFGASKPSDGEGQVAAWTFQLAKAALEADPVRGNATSCGGGNCRTAG